MLSNEMKYPCIIACIETSFLTLFTVDPGPPGQTLAAVVPGAVHTPTGVEAWILITLVHIWYVRITVFRLNLCMYLKCKHHYQNYEANFERFFKIRNALVIL